MSIDKYTAITALEAVQREGIDNLIDYLKQTDYFTAPASTSYHRAYEGGLLEHSVNVTELFHKRNQTMRKRLPQDSVTLCGLLHDACKIDCYEKVGDKYRIIKDHPIKKSHAKLSLENIEIFIDLTPEEKEIILYHMGLFGCYGYCVEYHPTELYSAISRNPLVQIFAACDAEEAKRNE